MNQNLREKDIRGCATEVDQWELFRESAELIVRPHENGDLFPKECRTCGRVYANLGEYVFRTEPKGHVFEDCSEAMGKPYTMVYRHCGCGNTLVMTLTAENSPHLERFWAILAKCAQDRNKPIVKIIEEFRTYFDAFVTGTLNERK